MILSNRSGRSSSVLPKTELARPKPNMVQVRVLVAGVYNGVNHKALPKAAEGDIIEVAAGAYAEDLVASHLVTTELTAPEAESSPMPENDPLVNEDPASPETLEVTSGTEPFAAPVPHKEQFPWDFLEGAGLNNQLAQALFEAGFFDREAVIEAFEQRGLKPFTDIKGIAAKRAEHLVAWAKAGETAKE